MLNNPVRRPIRRTNWRLLVMLVLLGAFLWSSRHKVFPSSPIVSENHNQLLIGDRALVRHTYDVELNTPVEFDFLSKTEVLQYRRDAVAKHAELIDSGYTPSSGVFGQIEDGRPWWGEAGQYFHGAGVRSIEGPSEESRYIVNPLLLVAADMAGLSPLAAGYQENSNRSSELSDPNFPLCCRPHSLTWWPHESRAEVIYDVSDHLEKLNRYAARPMSLSYAVFCLMPDNARDMNLNYLAVSPETSANVSRRGMERKVVRILHYLHRGGSCGYPGGCNNGSPYQAELDGFHVDSVPAHLDVLLWRDRPDDASQAPTMRFTLRFR